MISRVMTSFGGFIASTVSFVVYIVSRFVKVIALIAIGAIAILITALLVSGHFGLPYITMISPDPAISGFIGFYAGLIAFLIIPLIAIIRMGVNYAWRYKPNPKFKIAMSGIWIVAFMIFAMTAVFTARNFLYETSITETISEVESIPDQPFNIAISNPKFYDKMKLQFGRSFFTEGRFYNYEDIDVDVIPSEDDKVRIVRTTYSRGMNNSSAKRNAYYPSHHVSLEGNQLSLDDFYTINNKDKYRAQRYHYQVSVPTGTELSLNRHSRIFSNRKLRRGKRGEDSQKLVMTEEGLQTVEKG